MDFFQVLILGFIQGATEFLPISSSGHLYLMETYFGLKQNLSFEIYLHFASLLAVVIFFRKEILEIGYQLVCSNKLILKSKKKFKINKKGALGWKLLIATFLTAPIGILLEAYFNEILSVRSVAATLIFTGVLILFSDIFSRKKNINFSWRVAALLGIIQGFAVIPGISRSGLTIAFLILMGINRKEAAKISFLLAIPTIAGAALFALEDAGWRIPINGIQFVGCVTSFAVAILAIRFMMKWIEKRWIWFAPYCMLVGVGLWFGSW